MSERTLESMLSGGTLASAMQARYEEGAAYERARICKMLRALAESFANSGTDLPNDNEYRVEMLETARVLRMAVDHIDKSGQGPGRKT